MSDFRDEATKMVNAATIERVYEWAIDCVAEQLRAHARAEALEAERRAADETVALDSRDQSRVRAAINGRRVYEGRRAYETRKREDAEIKATGVDMDVDPPHRVASFYREAVHALRCRLGAPATPETWAALTTDQRKLLICSTPSHRLIDRGGAEWLNYLKTPAGKVGVALLEAAADQNFTARARREALVNKINLDAVMEWTVELLDSEFAMPTGERVTWGRATAAQHAERVRMLQQNAVANMEASARHDAALLALAESGAMCLDELVSS